MYFKLMRKKLIFVNFIISLYFWAIKKMFLIIFSFIRILTRSAFS